MNWRKFDLTKAIAEIENRYPPDDLITSYKDFLKHRDYLVHYKFNEKVFHSIISLSIELWNSNKRINRMSLIIAINKYSKNCLTKSEMPEQIVSSVINLLKLIIENKPEIKKENLNSMLTKTAYTLSEYKLSENDINILIQNYKKSEAILNILLKHPHKNKNIRDWVVKNFNNKHLRYKRAELISWVIDEEPDFIVDREVLIADFEYMNYLDIQIIQKYKDEVEAIKTFRKNMKGILPGSFSYSSLGYTEKENEEKLPRHLLPELKLTKRFYTYPIDMNESELTYKNVYVSKTNKYYWEHVYIPNFVQFHKSFHSELDTIWKKTMVWGIIYSRREDTDKLELIKKFYSDEVFPTFSYIGKKYKNVEFLKWILSTVK